MVVNTCCTDSSNKDKSSLTVISPLQTTRMQRVRMYAGLDSRVKPKSSSVYQLLSRDTEVQFIGLRGDLLAGEFVDDERTKFGLAHRLDLVEL